MPYDVRSYVQRQIFITDTMFERINDNLLVFIDTIPLTVMCQPHQRNTFRIHMLFAG